MPSDSGKGAAFKLLGAGYLVNSLVLKNAFLTSTNREALPVTKPEALRHFILGMKQPLDLETTSSGSESVTVYIQSFTSEPKIISISAVKGNAYPPPLPGQCHCFFCPKSSLPSVLLDAQIDLLRREAGPTSIILVKQNFNHIKN